MKEHGERLAGLHRRIRRRRSRTTNWPTRPESAALLGGRHIRSCSIAANSSGRCRRSSRCLEEPIASSSIVPMYFVCQRARAGRQGRADRPGARRAVLRLQAPPRRAIRRHRGGSCRAALRGVLERRRQPAAAQRDREAGRLRARHRRSARALPARLLARARRNGSTACSATACCPRRRSRRSRRGARSLPQMAAPRRARRLPALEIRSSLPDELLMFADKLSMAHGLEVRVPVSRPDRRRIRRAARRAA